MAAITVDTIRIGADNDVKLSGFRDSRAASSVYLNAGTVTFTLKTASGTAVSGAENVTMSYVADSDGIYLGSIDSSVSLTEHGTYYIEITAQEGTVDGFWREQVVAKYNES